MTQWSRRSPWLERLSGEARAMGKRVAVSLPSPPTRWAPERASW